MSHCPHCGAPYPDGASFCGSCGMPVAPAQARSNRAMKTILVVAIGGGCLLVLIAVVGMVAALIIPNFLDALQKAKTKRTVADMRTAGTALESYREQTGSYPSGGVSEVGPQLAGHGYQGKLEDGWKKPLRYSCLSSDGCTSYELASGGRDGAFEHEPGQYPQEAFDPTDYDADIVMSDGMFNRWPGGQGRQATGGG